MLSEDLILHFLPNVYTEYKVKAKSLIRITRNADLDPDALYRLKEEDLTLPGSVLMHAGFTLPMLRGDYPSFRLHLERI